jgi:peptide-methionine (R)-S-oxide reductase
LQQAEQSAAKDAFDAAAKTADKSADKKATTKVQPEPEFVRKSLLEWQRILPRGVFEVTRLKATEPAFTGKYASGHFHGTFLCACCDTPLFSSQTKFDSGTGWPSFWQPIKAQAIDRAFDSSDAEPRIEVMCHRCGAHLGHVFDDGPPPTGLRFCINSLSLKLKQPEGDTAKPATTKAKAKSKVKTTRSKSRATSRSSRNKATAKTTEPDSEASSDQNPGGTEVPAKDKSGGSGR